MRHFINTTATEISLARSVSLLSPMTPQPFGVLVIGARRMDEFFFHHNGTIEPWSGASDRSLRITIGATNSALPTFQADDFAPITVPHLGWAGVLDLDTAPLLTLLLAKGAQIGDFFQCSTLLTVEVIGASGFPTVYFQSGIILRALNYVPGGNGGPGNIYAHPAFYSLPALVGLASAVEDGTKLGGLSTAGGEFAPGSVVQAFFAPDVVVQFTRIASIAAQNVPWIVRPYDYDVATNPFQWRIVRVTRDGQGCAWNPDTGKWHYLLAQGPADAVSIGADQTGVSLPA